MQPAAATQLSAADPVLATVIATIPLPVWPLQANVLHDLLSCVIEQQIHYRSTKKVFQKMLDRAGLQQVTLENFQQFERFGLADAKLSANKYETLHSLLAFFSENNPDWLVLTDTEVRQHLSTIKGVGIWTMDMILLYTLQRPNIFPYDDYHLKEIMVKAYALNPQSRLKAQMLDIAAAWGEQRSLAVRYWLDWKLFQQRR